MRLYEASPGHFIPEGQTLATMDSDRSNGMDDFYFDGQGGSHSRPPLRVTLPQLTKTIWVTKDGQHIPVKQMTDSHLVNTIRMLRRYAEPRKAAHEMALDAYMVDAPDGAADAANGELVQLENMDIDEYIEGEIITFPAMLAEAKRRGLTTQ